MNIFEVIGDTLHAAGKAILQAIGGTGASELENVTNFLNGEPHSPSRFVLLQNGTWINAQGQRVFSHLGDEARDVLKQLASGQPYAPIVDLAADAVGDAITEGMGAGLESLTGDATGYDAAKAALATELSAANKAAAPEGDKSLTDTLVDDAEKVAEAAAAAALTGGAEVVAEVAEAATKKAAK